MSLEAITVEEVGGGLRAAFVNLPHFRTHSVRLAISAGSSHETPDAYGGAHFLEHITFQGTEGMPEEEDVHRYSDANGLSRNAFTSKMITKFIADGYDLEPVGYFVSQVALKPRLTDEALEGERKPIIDELRGYASSPHYYAQIAHDRAVRGEVFARPIGGSIEDVLSITPDSLRDYHHRHYKLGNALLVIGSAASVDEQREFAQALVADHTAGEPFEPNPVVYDQFNPWGLAASLEQVDLPPSAQSSVVIIHEVPEATTTREQFGYNLVGMMLSKAAHNRLRRELAICYEAHAGVYTMTDQNYRRDKSWAQLAISANLNGEDAIAGLDALNDDVLRRPLDELALESLLIGLRRNVDHLMEGNPSAIADRVINILTSSKRDEIELNEVEVFADSVSIDELRRLHRNIVDTRPLVLATSPGTDVLQAVGDWAQHLRS